MADFDLDCEWERGTLDAAFAELERECGAVVRGLTVSLWNSVLKKTPQFAGGMAASWSYSIGAPQFYDRSNMIDVDSLAAGQDKNGRWSVVNPLRQGHMDAINIANDDNVGSESPFKLGDTVYLANGVDHGEGPYSFDVESGVVRLRSVNLPGAPLARSLDLITNRYGQDISPRVAERLKALRIGGSSASSDS